MLRSLHFWSKSWTSSAVVVDHKKVGSGVGKLGSQSDGHDFGLGLRDLMRVDGDSCGTDVVA